MAALMDIPVGLFSILANSMLWDGVKLLLLGSVIETGRRIFFWVIDRFRLRWSICAEFEAGDITQEWIVNYLIKENIWRTPRNIFVKLKNNRRKLKLSTGTKDDTVDFVPEYGFVQFFRWRGYWFEVSGIKDQSETESRRPPRHRAPGNIISEQTHSTAISLNIFTLDISVLYAFVEECRQKYADHTKSQVTVYTADRIRPRYSHGAEWNSAKMMRRRPLDSLLLDNNIIDSLLDDAREFLSVEEWYTEAGIPHRRGYLLHGPPGTGKTSTIYTVAGELGLEIYALSLSSKFLDDSRLARLVSLLPPRGILVLEDIDCAFPSRDDGDENEYDSITPWGRIPRRSQVTMSGLLNILDGIGSEEGKIFFATTNHIDRLDPALMRPGRIDRKIEYQLASQEQARRLFLRFFPDSTFATATDGLSDANTKKADMARFASEFASAIPPNEFSMAEIQGYLLGCRTSPIDIVCGIQAWVERERDAKRDKNVREQSLKERIAAGKAAWQRRFAVPNPVAPLTPIPHGQAQPRDTHPDPGSPGNTASQTSVDQALHEPSDNTGNLNDSCNSSLNAVDLACVEDYV